MAADPPFADLFKVVNVTVENVQWSGHVFLVYFYSPLQESPSVFQAMTV